MKDDVWSTVTADADAFKDLKTEAGGELSELIRQVNSEIKKVSAAEENLKVLKQKRDQYLYDLIPAKMAEVGMDKVEVDGNAVSLQTFVSATMPKDPMQKDVALAHLRQIGCSDFIKNQIQVSFGVTEDNRAKALQDDLENQGHDTTSRTWVEPMTLKELVRERIENSQEIDMEIFNAKIGTIAKIKGA